MAKATGLAPEQLRALDRLKSAPGIERFYLAGASAITWHLGHRRSVDLDLFSKSSRVSLERLEGALGSTPGVRIIDSTDVTVAVKVGQVPVDFVKYPYPPLDPLTPGPSDFPVASLRDLAAMKLVAIARRGIRRDFWDLYEIARAGISLPLAAQAYLERFGKAKSDLYAVQRALTWFADAESDPVHVRGMTPALWRRIRAFFEKEAPRLLNEP